MPTDPQPETTVNFREFRRSLSGYLRATHDGAAIGVTSRGERMARLGTPTPKTAERHLLVGMFRGHLPAADPIDQTPAGLVATVEMET